MNAPVHRVQKEIERGSALQRPNEHFRTLGLRLVSLWRFAGLHAQQHRHPKCAENGGKASNGALRLGLLGALLALALLEVQGHQQFSCRPRGLRHHGSSREVLYIPFFVTKDD